MQLNVNTPQFSATLEEKKAAREILMDTIIKQLPNANAMVNKYIDTDKGDGSNYNCRGKARLAVFNAAAVLLASDPELNMDTFSSGL